MKKNIFIKFVITCIAFFAALFFTSCRSLPSAAQEPVVSIQSAELTGIDINGVQLLCKVEVKNPNSFDIPFPETDWTLYINTNSFANGTVKRNHRIRARSSAIVEVPVNIEYFGFFNTFRSLIGARQVDYKLALGVKIQTPVLGDKVWNIEHNGTLPLPQQPRFSSPSMKVENASSARADVIISINVENPNIFPLPAPSIKYDYILNRNSFIRGEIINARPLAASSITPLELKLQVSFSDLFRSFSALRNLREVASNLIFEADFGIPVFKGEVFRFELPGNLQLPRLF